MSFLARGGVAASLAVAVTLLIHTESANGQQTAPASQSGAAGKKGGGNFREPDPLDFEDHLGFTQIFDGETLKDWDGNPDVWRVENHAIVGESTREKPAGNTFLVYRAVEARDFDLKLEIKVENGGGSGIQYRSHTGLPENASGGRAGGSNGAQPPRDPRWTMIGPQMDFWLALNPNNSRYTGQLYPQNNGRGIIAWRGQVVESLPAKTPRLVGYAGDRAELGGYVKFADWNQLTMIVRGGTFLHILNGQLMAVLVDDDLASSNNASGLFGLQIEGTPCKVSFRNLWLKKIS